MKDNLFLGILGVIGVLAVIAVILGFPFMWLWNWLMPTIFNLPEITFWQSIGLQFLAAFIFGNKVSSNNN